MHYRRITFGALLICLVLQFWHCDKNIQITDFDKSAFPDPPITLRVSIASGKIILSWSHPDVSQIERYKIYRQSLLDTTLTLIDSTASLTYTDERVNSGVTYRYGVSAVKNGYEGARLLSTPVALAVFGVSINSGAEFTNSRSVILTLIAPANATFMKISNDSLFLPSQWEPYATTRVWTLPEGDGEKAVFVHFRDAQENETFAPSKATIILDTRANISDVMENTAGQVKSAGEVIHFSLTSGETEGTASVDLGQVRLGIRLFDDGSNGDDVEDDGVYHRDFQIPAGLEVIDASVTGHFTDRLGNVAETREAAGKITIQSPPAAVTLLTPEAISGSTVALRLSWTQSADADFASYKLYRSVSPDVSTNSTFVASIETIFTLSFVDDNLQEKTTYYYRLYVVDVSGLSAVSNEVHETTLEKEPPESVTLFEPEATDGSILLSWSQYRDSDFESYKIFRAKVPGVTAGSKLLAIVGLRTVTAYEDTDIEDNTLYFYRVFVFDTQGGSGGSNEVSVTSKPNEPPAPVTLAKPGQVGDTALLLNWSRSSAEDFASYRIYRSQFSPVDTTEAPIAILNSNPDITAFSDSDVQVNVQYFYRVFVFDEAGLSAGSNEEAGRLK